jgi:hypothetical protein
MILDQFSRDQFGRPRPATAASPIEPTAAAPIAGSVSPTRTGSVWPTVDTSAAQAPVPAPVDPPPAPVAPVAEDYRECGAYGTA